MRIVCNLFALWILTRASTQPEHIEVEELSGLLTTPSPPTQVAGDSQVIEGPPLAEQASGNSDPPVLQGSLEHVPLTKLYNSQSQEVLPGQGFTLIDQVSSTIGYTTPIPSPPLRIALRDRERKLRQKLPKLSPFTREILTDQFAMDDVENSIPNIYDDHREKISKIGELFLRKNIYYGMFSSVFELADSTGRPTPYIIKYEWNCDDFGANVHPLIRDYKFGTEASQIGISPKPIAISAPAKFKGLKTRKTNFHLTFEDIKWCTSFQSNLRYIVMEKVEGISAKDMRDRDCPNKICDMFRSLSITYYTLLGLEELHNAGIVHGDIHWGNIMFEFTKDRRIVLNYDTENDKVIGLKFVDFGRSSRLGNHPAEPIYPFGEHLHYMFSHWQIAGYAWSARDDVYKTLVMLASLINDFDEFFEHQNSFEKASGSDLFEWKSNGFIFQVPGAKYDPFEKLSAILTQEKISIIRKNLQIVLDLVRSLDDINGPIPYRDIVNPIGECMDLFEYQ
jgi:hypothetical protein